MNAIDHYMNRRTIIVGDVNSGKTVLTLKILNCFLKTGYAEKIAIIDLAPDKTQGIGGKLTVPQDQSLLYLTTSIATPRLTGRDDDHIRQLAEKNAMAIESLFKNIFSEKRNILFINDATLYLQAGDFERFTQLLDTASTQIINVYYGHTFPHSRLTDREKKLTQRLIKTCSQIIHMPLD
jgi:GTPase SAR1 family protein